MPGIRFHPLSIIALALLAPAAKAACPDLSPYYPGLQPDWPALERRLAPLIPQCLESSEFYALYGAAQMNAGALAGALESLERALLLNPDNGAAQVDFAQALYLQGELFPALELNERILARKDLPSNLRPALTDRQRDWRAQTRQRSWNLDALAGFDTNLNGAPDPSQITLTLSGESVILTLGPDFQPVSGPYVNLRMAGRQRQLTPRHQHNLTVDVRGRISEDSASDLLQADARYAFIRPDPDHAWQLSGGLSSLMFGGSPLYTGLDVSARYQPGSQRTCRSFLGLATQTQRFHEQNFLNAQESKAGAGLSCPWSGARGRHLLTMEAAALHSLALNNGRPGGDRNGWQLNLDWQYQTGSAELRTLISHTDFDDRQGYSPVLDDGATRWLHRTYILLQYRQPLLQRLAFVVNLYHQDQRSNLALFQSVDSTLEVGVSYGF